jgi:hypothetical protein
MFERGVLVLTQTFSLSEVSVLHMRLSLREWLERLGLHTKTFLLTYVFGLSWGVLLKL